MLSTDKRTGLFNVKEIWFSDKPFDAKGCHAIVFKDCKTKATIDGFECSEFPTLIIDLTQDLDTIWRNMGKKSCRYEIKRAAKLGIVVQKSTDYRTFQALNARFRKMKGFGGKISLNYLRAYGTLFMAYLDGELVAGQVYMMAGDDIRWSLGASKRLEVDKDKQALIGCANRALIWEAIKYAKEKGIKEFDFGGAYGTDDNVQPQWQSISFFKHTFGGIPAMHYTYTKSYSPLYKLAVWLWSHRSNTAHSGKPADYTNPTRYETEHHKQHYLINHWKPLILAAIERYGKSKTVVDLGCGTGFYTIPAMDYARTVIGIDSALPMLEYAIIKKHKLSLILADAHNIPLRDEFADVVLCIGLLEQLRINRTTVLGEIHRLLQTGGKAIILGPNKYGAVRGLHRLFCGLTGKDYNYNEPSYAELSKLTEQSGFNIIKRIMNDGYVWGGFHWSCKLIELAWATIRINPFSNLMLFVIEKGESDAEKR